VSHAEKLALIFLDVDDAAMLGVRGNVDFRQIMEENTVAHQVLDDMNDVVI
jgi:hypothetical protein